MKARLLGAVAVAMIQPAIGWMDPPSGRKGTKTQENQAYQLYSHEEQVAIQTAARLEAERAERKRVREEEAVKQAAADAAAEAARIEAERRQAIADAKALAAANKKAHEDAFAARLAKSAADEAKVNEFSIKRSSYTHHVINEFVLRSVARPRFCAAVPGASTSMPGGYRNGDIIHLTAHLGDNTGVTFIPSSAVPRPRGNYGAVQRDGRVAAVSLRPIEPLYPPRVVKNVLPRL